ncbi:MULTISPECIES: hypothetical protein [unclassified Brenneria]|uniref:hypothetical protein n=1 Tax=unclassified Brenneria TaxID=2634434 RepID=UPI0029C1950A|nr:MULTISPECIES: hypothetical protein [unclassified Brenneria]MDX5628401.1 hypothetical protein [Brenneria sp. L3-3Z]MDX5695416.1 hypothetical protein [Brenneria sp. L4-2C]
MAISVSYLLFLVVLTLLLSYFMAGLFFGKGILPECLKIRNWSVAAFVSFVVFESALLYIVSLQATGYMPTLQQVF